MFTIESSLNFVSVLYEIAFYFLWNCWYEYIKSDKVICLELDDADCYNPNLS